MAALRAGNLHAPLILIVAAFICLRLILLAGSEVRRRRCPSGPPVGSGCAVRSGRPRRSARPYAGGSARLDRAHADPDLYSRNVLPVLAELADERLRLRHGITRATDPRRARELLGDPMWAALHDPGRRAAKTRDIETSVDVLERL